jgi:hypothetical protein
MGTPEILDGPAPRGICASGKAGGPVVPRGGVPARPTPPHAQSPAALRVERKIRARGVGPGGDSLSEDTPTRAAWRLAVFCSTQAPSRILGVP